MAHIQFPRLLTLLVATLIAQGASAGDFQLLGMHRIGGDGGWDYLSYDSASKRLFIARGQHVQVVDPVSGEVVGDIADTPGVHGIALAPELDKGFTSNGRDNSVTVFTTSTLKPLAKIQTPAGENPDFIAYDRVTQRVVAFNGRSHNASLIDAVGARLVGTVALAGKPEAAVADGRGTMFVDIEDTNQIQAINLKTGTVIASWPLAGCDEPAGLAIDPTTRRLFVGCHNKTLLVVNADDGKVLHRLAIGEGVDATAFDEQRKLVFSSQADGTLSIIQEVSADEFRPLPTVMTAPGARTMALNPADHRIYLVTAEFEAPAAPASGARPRRVMKPGSFSLLVVGEK
jgi:DNA-binding beta-propeller fold protein YncE